MSAQIIGSTMTPTDQAPGLEPCPLPGPHYPEFSEQTILTAIEGVDDDPLGLYAATVQHVLCHHEGSEA